jgi:DNA-binding protein H-NS
MNPHNARSLIVAVAALCFVSAFSNAASAQESVVELLRRELGEMQQQVKKLVERIEQLEQEKTAQAPQQTTPEQSAAATQPQPASAKGISSAFNPAISVNALFNGGYSSNPKTTRRLTGLDFQNGFNFQEAELQFTADVDPYWKANLIFSVNRAGDAGIEEGYVTSEELPYDLLPRNTTLKLGKFYASFGKHNLLHAHQFPFIDKPLVSQAVFGDEGLKEPGAGLSYLLPTSWFSELTFQGMAGENEEMFRFNGGSKPRGAYLGHWKNFFDLSDETTLEIGNSYIGGRNSASGHPWSHAAGLDLTIKWRPLQRSTEKALIWQTEYIYFNEDRGRSGSSQGGGIYSSLQYQFAQRWWIQGRYDLLGIPNFDGERKHRWTTLLAFVPSEFSAIRLQHSYTIQDRGGPVNQILLQFNFTIGSHPAHQY